MYYDYGKLYQSILGYDLVLNGHNRDVEYISTTKKYFLEKKLLRLEQKKIDLDSLI